MNNRVAGALMGPHPTVVPVFALDSGWDLYDWLQGLRDGMRLRNGGLGPRGAGRARACIEAGVGVVGVRDYFRAGEWRQAFEEVQPPFVREGPKVGRNDPCPSGSGKKFKKCWGETGGTAH